MKAKKKSVRKKENVHRMIFFLGLLLLGILLSALYIQKNFSQTAYSQYNSYLK